jgi:AcrR family transcriptional regulator
MSQSADNPDTRAKLLHTALHLYARDGLHGVSLRRIATEAGSRNSAAMHYHFGDKLGVIAALASMIAEKMASITREIRINEPTPDTLHGAFRNALRPLTELPQHCSWGTDAVRFMSLAISENSPEIAAVINPIYKPFWNKVDGQLAQLLPELPQGTRQLRLMFMSVNVFHGAAEVASLAHTPLGDMSHFDRNTLLDELVDYLIGGLRAPTGNHDYAPMKSNVSL